MAWADRCEFGVADRVRSYCLSFICVRRDEVVSNRRGRILFASGLHQDAVDVVDVDGFTGTAYDFDETADAEVTGFTQHSVGGADDEIDGGLTLSTSNSNLPPSACSMA